MAKQNIGPSPAWLYGILNWIKRTPLGGWLVALAIFFLGVILQHIPLWHLGLLPLYQIDPLLIFPATWFPGGLLFWLWQDRVASNSIREFARGIGKTEAETDELYNRFISLPNNTAIVLLAVGLLGGGSYAVQQSALQGYSNPLYILAAALIPTLGSASELLAIWRWIRQLIQVNQMYRQVTKINLFDLWPIYALSRYGYSIAALAILTTVLTDVVIRLDGGPGLSLFNFLYSVLFGLVIFIVPLLGINAHLRRAKQSNLQRLGDQLNNVYTRIEAAITKGKLEDVALLKNAAGALREQMEAIQKVATWPWNPGSLRNLLLPVLLPLLIAILQRYVLSWLGLV